MFILYCPGQTVSLHRDPDGLTDGEEQEEREVVVDIPGMDEDPDAHEVRGPVEAVEPQRVALDVLVFGHDDREDVDKEAEDDGKADRDPCADPAGCADGKVIDEVLTGNVGQRTVCIRHVAPRQFLKDVHNVLLSNFHTGCLF